MAGRTTWNDGRLDELAQNVDARFDKVDLRFEQVDLRFKQVDERFDRVETDIRELRSLNWWLWATTMLTILGVLVTVLLRT